MNAKGCGIRPFCLLFVVTSHICGTDVCLSRFRVLLASAGFISLQPHDPRDALQESRKPLTVSLQALPVCSHDAVGHLI